MVFSDTITDTLYPEGEARVRPLTGEQLARVNREDAQRWLRELVANAPMEVTVVGDLDRERAVELVRTYFGSLSARERISDSTLDALRGVTRPTGPLTAARSVPSQTDQGLVLSGFFGADITDARDLRLLSAAATILTTRMTEQLREEAGLSYSPSVQSSPGVELSGYGTVHALTTTAPDKAATLMDRFAVMFAAFAREGPTGEELAVMKRQMANRLDERMREPAYWSRAISSSTYRGTSVQDAVDEPAAYETMTAEQIRDAFARYYRPETRFEVTVQPAAAPAGEAAPGKEP
jgi:zinc protease